MENSSGGINWQVSWHPGAVPELASISDMRETRAIADVIAKLQVEGTMLGWPHSSAVRGPAGRGLRELRPRAGRSRWRPIYERTGVNTLTVLSIAPEAAIDPRGFRRGLQRASRRRDEGRQ